MIIQACVFKVSILLHATWPADVREVALEALPAPLNLRENITSIEVVDDNVVHCGGRSLCGIPVVEGLVPQGLGSGSEGVRARLALAAPVMRRGRA